jgi:hypothetical protein
MYLQPNKINKSTSQLLNGDFDLVSLTRDSQKLDKLTCKLNYIAILPFERTADDRIKAVYGLKFENHATGQTDTSLLIDIVDPTKDQTPFDTVCRALLEEAGVNVEELGVDENDIFYLGTISTTTPVNSKFKCYAVDLTNAANPESPIEFARTLSKSNFDKDSSEIVKIGFHQVVNGDFTDSTILAGSFLLVSYFN